MVSFLFKTCHIKYLLLNSHITLTWQSVQYIPRNDDRSSVQCDWVYNILPKAEKLQEFHRSACYSPTGFTVGDYRITLRLSVCSTVCNILFLASWKNYKSYITQTFHKCLLWHVVIARPFQFHLPPMSRSHFEVKGQKFATLAITPLLVDGFISYLDTRSVLIRPFLWYIQHQCQGHI